MYRLKLTKARSYTRGGVTVTQEKPFADVEDAETVEALLSSGYFTLVSSPDVPGAEPDNSGTEGTEADGSGTEGTEADSDGTEGTEPDSSEPEGTELKPDYDALSKMSKADLTVYAKEREIDIGKCKTKSDILTAISMAYGGSPTMIDLQRDNQGGDNE